MTTDPLAKAQRRGDIWKTKAIEIEADRDRIDKVAEELRRKLASSELIRENADFHLGQEMARRQLAEKETARLWAVVARLRQMTDHWEKQLPEVIRTPAVVSAIRAALGDADGPSRMADEAQPATSDRCPHGCDVSTCPCLACEADQPDGETQQPETGPFVPPAHYRGRDGTAYCVHAIPIGPDSCPHCRELADEQPAAVSQPGKEA